LRTEIENHSPFSAGLIVSVHFSCLNHLNKTTNEEIRATINESHNLGLKIKAARQVGRNCAKVALWIPVMQCEQYHFASPYADAQNLSSDPNPILHQHMVETKALFNKGTSTGAIDKDAIIVGVPNGWRLMQAPPTTSKQAYAIIFWEPSSVEDREPTFTKVVGVFILFYLL
jgi:hypothetical protein